MWIVQARPGGRLHMAGEGAYPAYGRLKRIVRDAGKVHRAPSLSRQERAVRAGGAWGVRVGMKLSRKR